MVDETAKYPFDAPDWLRARLDRGSGSLPQAQALKCAVCVKIYEEQASGVNRAWPVLARALERAAKVDMLVVVRIDGLERSLSRLIKSALPEAGRWTQIRLPRAVPPMSATAFCMPRC